MCTWILLQHWENSTFFCRVLPARFLSAVSLRVVTVHNLCVSSGRAVEEEQCVCPSCCLSGLQGWNHLSFVDLGEGKNWRLSCIPREVQELMTGTKTVFFVMVFGHMSFFFSLLCLYSSGSSGWQANSGLEKKARLLPPVISPHSIGL